MSKSVESDVRFVDDGAGDEVSVGVGGLLLALAFAVGFGIRGLRLVGPGVVPKALPLTLSGFLLLAPEGVTVALVSEPGAGVFLFREIGIAGAMPFSRPIRLRSLWARLKFARHAARAFCISATSFVLSRYSRSGLWRCLALVVCVPFEGLVSSGGLGCCRCVNSRNCVRVLTGVACRYGWSRSLVSPGQVGPGWRR